MYYLNNEGERVYTLKVIIKKSNYKKKKHIDWLNCHVRVEDWS